MRAHRPNPQQGRRSPSCACGQRGPVLSLPSLQATRHPLPVPAPGAAGNPAETVPTQEEEVGEEEEKEDSLALNGHITNTAASESSFVAG